MSDRITCCYLYTITKYGYPPAAANSKTYLEEYARLGFSSVELEGIRAEHLTEMFEQKDSVRNKIDALGLQVPYYCAVLPGLSSPDEQERSQNLELFERGCQTAQTFGALGVLDNAPLPPYQFPADIPIVRHYHEDVVLSAQFPSDLNWKSYWQQLIETYREACDIAAKYGLTYQMHPALGVLSSTTDAFLYFHDAVKRDNLRFNFDTANQYALKDNLPLSLIRLADYIDYIHISDNGGQKIEHLKLGEGIINWDSFFETIHRIGFKGHFGVDIGGAESDVSDLDEAYRHAIQFIKDRL
ncbi:MAG: sugar phosphate isomerase/epimerase family protein [Bacteroidota bacterium]